MIFVARTADSSWVAAKMSARHDLDLSEFRTTGNFYGAQAEVYAPSYGTLHAQLAFSLAAGSAQQNTCRPVFGWQCHCISEY